MICPYCGKEIERPTREHFFPQSVCCNEWDFWACYSCNKLKREHVVYPATQLFKQWPENFSTTKFKQLWRLSGWDKYLNLVPAIRMRQIFDSGRWKDGAYLFSIEERLCYGLDYLKEMYELYDKLLKEDDNLQALIIAPTMRRVFIIHSYSCEFGTPYKEVESLRVDKWVDMRVAGWLVLGSARHYVWKSTVSYKEYFRRLLSAPSCEQILSDKWGLLEGY